MIVYLDRLYSRDGGVFSLLSFTPDGSKRISLVACEKLTTLIPEGDYTIKRDFTGRYQHWVILGGDLGLHGSGSPREQVEIHIGNWPLLGSDGCVLPGVSIGRMSPPDRDMDIEAVRESGAALRILHTHLQDDDHTLRVSRMFR